MGDEKQTFHEAIVAAWKIYCDAIAPSEKTFHEAIVATEKAYYGVIASGTEIEREK